ncbi:hypothetical protein [Polaribacter atrinae]|nr:hypothetical protein [Polaribacter atrinae]
MKKNIRFLVMFSLLLMFSCKSTKQERHPYLQNSNKFYTIITKEQADKSHKYFKLTAPKEWNIYYDAHNWILYSPLGAEKMKRIELSKLKDTSLKKEKARAIYEFNQQNQNKKGNYWSNNLTAHSKNKDSIKVYNYEDAINLYLKNKKLQFKTDFNYKIVREKDKRFGEIIYIKYNIDYTWNNETHIDAIMIGDKRVYYVFFQSEEAYYPFYFNDAIEIIKSLEIKE